MIQINLVPDIKQEFLRAQAMKRLVMTMSFFVSVGFIGLVVLMFTIVSVWQQSRISGKDDEIATLISQYQELQDVSEVLTVNNQLEELPRLHDEKPAFTRLAGYLTKLVPEDVSMSNITIDNQQGFMTIKGTGKDIKLVNQFVDTLKNAVYYVQRDEEEEPEEGFEEEIEVRRVFTAVVLERVGNNTSKDTKDDEGGATYEIRAIYDNTIFNNALKIALTIPITTSDDVELLSPEDLIDPAALDAAEREGDLFNDDRPTEGEEQP